MAVTPASDRTATRPGRPAESSEEIAGRLRLSATRLARRLRQEAHTGLSPSQLSALAAVERHGPLTLGALAEHEQVAPPSVTRVVAKLEADGLLTRQPDPDDRRVTRVLVTPKGRNLLEHFAPAQDRRGWPPASSRSIAETRACVAEALDALDALTTERR